MGRFDQSSCRVQVQQVLTESFERVFFGCSFGLVSCKNLHLSFAGSFRVEG